MFSLMARGKVRAPFPAIVFVCRGQKETKFYAISSLVRASSVQGELFMRISCQLCSLYLSVSPFLSSLLSSPPSPLSPPSLPFPSLLNPIRLIILPSI